MAFSFSLSPFPLAFRPMKHLARVPTVLQLPEKESQFHRNSQKENYIYIHVYMFSEISKFPMMGTGEGRAPNQQRKLFALVKIGNRCIFIGEYPISGLMGSI